MEVTGAALVLLAGGRGERAGGSTAKQFATDQHGRALLARGAATALGALRWSQVIVVIPAGSSAGVAQMLAGDGVEGVSLIEGGPGRLDSMERGVFAVDARRSSVTVIHDGTRPFTPPSLFAEVVRSVRDDGADAAWPTVHPANTVMAVAGERPVHLPSADLLVLSTPIAVRTHVVRALLEDRPPDAGAVLPLMIAAGLSWVAVPDSPLNFKVTTPRDLHDALALMSTQPWPEGIPE